jgi:predicted nucleotidyltransferase
VELDDAIAALLGELDRRWGIDAAWLFGSQTRRPRLDSDIDLAVLFRSPPSAVELLEASADLERIAGKAVDVVDLDRASPIVAHQAIKNGRLVHDRDPHRRIAFVSHLPARYEDVSLVRKSIERLLLQRIAHGRA